MSYGTSTPGADGAQLRITFRTMCGREIQVGQLALGGGPHPAQRISLDIGAPPGGGTGTWAGLTVAEARWLAEAACSRRLGCGQWPPSKISRLPVARRT